MIARDALTLPLSLPLSLSLRFSRLRFPRPFCLSVPSVFCPSP